MATHTRPHLCSLNFVFELHQRLIRSFAVAAAMSNPVVREPYEFVLGLCLGCAWGVRGLCMGCAHTGHGACGLCMGCAHAVHGVCGTRLFVPVLMQSHVTKLRTQLVCPRLNDSQQTAAQVHINIAEDTLHPNCASAGSSQQTAA